MEKSTLKQSSGYRKGVSIMNTQQSWMPADDSHKNIKDTGVEGGKIEENRANNNGKGIRDGNGECNYNIFCTCIIIKITKMSVAAFPTIPAQQW